jgi:hypothetical protein
LLTISQIVIPRFSKRGVSEADGVFFFFNSSHLKEDLGGVTFTLTSSTYYKKYTFYNLN